MKYAGITIGPIFDTIMDAVSPAALWFASTFFSDLTRRLCIKIGEEWKNSKNYELISPDFDEADREGLKDGVGKYHDRIFFQAEDISASALKRIVDRAKKEMAEDERIFGADFYRAAKMDRECAEAFLKDYLQIHYIILEESQIGQNNCILALSPYLDALELMRSFPSSDRDNPIRRLMKGRPEGRNAFIRESGLYAQVDDGKNPLKSPNGDIWEIQEIARGKRQGYISDDKYLDYYALVSADADGMGRFLKAIPQEKTRLFSQRCLAYDKEAAKIINEYGGMVIYAGGDDLLFLAPVKNGETIFDICKKISQEFEKTIRGAKGDEGFGKAQIPTVSFGISAQYYKYPLYEALSRSRDYLEIAKKALFRDNSGGPEKNCIYFGLEKHSGQSADILIGNEALDSYIELLDKTIAVSSGASPQADDRGSEQEKMVKSLGTKLYEERILIGLMDEKYKERGHKDRPCWDNLFDNEGQQGGEEFRKFVEKWYYDHLVEGEKRIFKRSEDELQSLLSVLRIHKFFLEKRGERYE